MAGSRARTIRCRRPSHGATAITTRPQPRPRRPWEFRVGIRSMRCCGIDQGAPGRGHISSAL
jgi:hypothetical protein